MTGSPDTPLCVLIAGPTASGKSALALDLAEHLGGEIINADSMQVYADLHVLSARPAVEDLRRCRHWHYGDVDGADAWSVGRWLVRVKAALADIHARGRIPIFVGGTGLYFRGLTEGISPIPDIPPEIRNGWRARMEREGPHRLHGLLARADPAAAEAILKSDAQRILRALEVCDATGVRMSEWRTRKGIPLVQPNNALRVFLDPDRCWLYARINRRFDIMVDNGALGEVEALTARGLSSELPVMRAHGVPHLRAYLAGKMDILNAAERTKADTRHYAKRQKTWFRNQMDGWTALPTGDRAVRATDLLRLLPLDA
ncbi:MAG: tRNA (adenosine(37)-N6)-dimethylallyltransferase MiaA [Pseudomonadota bacterium]